MNEIPLDSGAVEEALTAFAWTWAAKAAPGNSSVDTTANRTGNRNAMSRLPYFFVADLAGGTALSSSRISCSTIFSSPGL